MPIIRSGEQARSVLKPVIEEGRSMPCFCTESLYTTEAIFRGAGEFRSAHRIPGKLPLIISFTASYPDRQQLRNYTSLEDVREGLLAVRSDIERLAREDGPYSGLDVMVHLDHAQPGQDDWIIEENEDFISSVMWDCSHYSLKENMSMMKDFVARYKTSYIIEGAVDEIYNYSVDIAGTNTVPLLTDPATAEMYYRETGVDLIVPNLGTEHRRTEGTVKYHGEVAREIRDRIGRRLVLHGTSSLGERELHALPEDGIVKVNLWASLESRPGSLLADRLIRNLEKQLSQDAAADLVKEGILSENMLNKQYKPSIGHLTEKYRRDSIIIPEASSIVRYFLEVLFNPA
jgi:fructose-bisphosphate aldolase class II